MGLPIAMQASSRPHRQGSRGSCGEGSGRGVGAAAAAAINGRLVCLGRGTPVLPAGAVAGLGLRFVLKD